MLKSLLSINEIPKNLDATDGLAAAVCHFYNSQNKNFDAKYSNWESFIKKNQHKIKGS